MCICLAHSAGFLFTDKKSCMRKYDLCLDKSPSKQRQSSYGVYQCDMWFSFLHLNKNQEEKVAYATCGRKTYLLI